MSSSGDGKWTLKLNRVIFSMIVILILCRVEFSTTPHAFFVRLHFPDIIIRSAA